MTNNFNPKKSGAAERPQLSPEEYVAKKKAEKDAVYQMIDDGGIVPYEMFYGAGCMCAAAG